MKKRASAAEPSNHISIRLGLGLLSTVQAQLGGVDPCTILLEHPMTRPVAALLEDLIALRNELRQNNLLILTLSHTPLQLAIGLTIL